MSQGPSSQTPQLKLQTTSVNGVLKPIKIIKARALLFQAMYLRYCHQKAIVLNDGQSFYFEYEKLSEKIAALKSDIHDYVQLRKDSSCYTEEDALKTSIGNLNMAIHKWRKVLLHHHIWASTLISIYVGQKLMQSAEFQALIKTWHQSEIAAARDALSLYDMHLASRVAMMSQDQFRTYILGNCVSSKKNLRLIETLIDSVTDIGYLWPEAFLDQPTTFPSLPADAFLSQPQITAPTTPKVIINLDDAPTKETTHLVKPSDKAKGCLIS